MVIKIKSIHLSSGEVVTPADGLTVIVGPNNVGKSRLLHEVNDKLSGFAFPGHVVVERVDIQREGDTDHLLQWLKLHHEFRKPGEYEHGFMHEWHFPSANTSEYLTPQAIEAEWEHGVASLGRLRGFLVHYMGAEGHGHAVSNTSSFHVGRQTPSSPTHMLYLRRDLEQKASGIMRRAFGVSLTVNRYAGSMITLHVGAVIAEEGPAPGDEAYRQEIESLRTLQEQGDGMKAFMGIVLTIITAGYPLILIDEPEAFLHPPQAYLLGQFLAEQHESGSQVIISTHSDDIVRGIMSIKGASGNVSVARLTRDSAGNHVAQVPVTEVQELYEDPLIKYYGILDGLFAHGTVLCEADSDCTYYRAVLEATIPTLQDDYPTSALSLHFAHCGGKGRLAKAATALNSARVPVVCAVDIDLFQQEREWAELITAFGGDPDELKADRNVVVDAVQSGNERIERAYFEHRVSELLERRRDPFLTPGDLSTIKRLASPATGWRAFKKTGRAWLRGEAVESFDRADSYLRGLGIFVVPVGELEGFHPEVPSKNKAAWLRQVLEEKKYLKSPDASRYVQALVENVWKRQG